MNPKLLSCLAALTILAASDSVLAATLYYNGNTGTAYIDPTDRGATPTGKVVGYRLASNGKFFVEPTRMSLFPAPAPRFFVNSSSEIIDNDFLFQGTSNIINLGILFSAGNRPRSQAGLLANFADRKYLVPSGDGRIILPVVFIPEPATARMTGLGLMGLLAVRRRRP